LVEIHVFAAHNEDMAKSPWVVFTRIAGLPLVYIARAHGALKRAALGPLLSTP